MGRGNKCRAPCLGSQIQSIGGRCETLPGRRDDIMSGAPAPAQNDTVSARPAMKFQLWSQSPVAS